METIFTEQQPKGIDIITALKEAGVEAPELVYATCLQRAKEIEPAENLTTEDIALLLLFTFNYSVLPPDNDEVCGLTPLDALNIALVSGPAEHPSIKGLLWLMWGALRKLPHEYFPGIFVRIPVKVLSASDDEERVVKNAFLKASLDPSVVGLPPQQQQQQQPALSPAAVSPAGTSPNPSYLGLGDSSSSSASLSTSASALSMVGSNASASSLSRFMVKLTGFVSVYNLDKYSFFPGRQSKNEFFNCVCSFVLFCLLLL